MDDWDRVDGPWVLSENVVTFQGLAIMFCRLAMEISLNSHGFAVTFQRQILSVERKSITYIQLQQRFSSF